MERHQSGHPCLQHQHHVADGHAGGIKNIAPPPSPPIRGGDEDAIPIPPPIGGWGAKHQRAPARSSRALFGLNFCSYDSTLAEVMAAVTASTIGVNCA